MLLRQFTATVIASVVGACSVYPLPQETTGATTEQIVQHVRCEARDGLRATVLQALDTHYKDVFVRGRMKGPDLATKLREDPSYWHKLSVDGFSGDAKEAFKYYENSQIAYEFTLDLQESNTDTAGIKLSRNFTSKRVDTLDFGGISARGRSNKRNFNIVDTFGELALKVPDAYCNTPATVNFVYPIVGSLPIHDLLRSYIETNEFHNLGGPGTTDFKAIFGTRSSPAVPQMGDTIIFTTRFTGSFGPTFAPAAIVGAGFLPTSATFKTEDFREDKHQVIIVVSTSPEAAKLDPVNPRLAPPLAFGAGAGGSPAPARTTGLRPSSNGLLTDARFRYGIRTLELQRQKNVDDAIVRIGDSLSRLAP